MRQGVNPDNYLNLTPVWRFSDFDWDGDWGHGACVFSAQKARAHFEKHLGSFETMTWAEILKQSGERSRGNNHHEIETSKFKKAIRERLKSRGINADVLFSLRLDQATRIYGVREGRCLRIVFFDPFHTDKSRCAYEFG